MFQWLILLLGLSSQPGPGSIKVKVTRVSEKQGEVMLALFQSSKGFPYETSFAVSKLKGKALNGNTEVIFSGIKPGTYAIAIFHDTNGDGRLNTNIIGIPKEGYGVSNNNYNTFSAPGYKESSFQHNDRTELTIQMKY